MSFIKSFFKLLFSPVLYLFISIRYLITYLTSYKSRLRQIKAIREDRILNQSNPSEIDRMQADYLYFFSKWGVDENCLSRVIRGLTNDAIIYTGVAILPVIGLIMDPLSSFSYIYWIGSLLTSPACLFVATTRLWKATCLKNKQFIPYKEYLFGIDY